MIPVRWALEGWADRARRYCPDKKRAPFMAAPVSFLTVRDMKRGPGSCGCQRALVAGSASRAATASSALLSVGMVWMVPKS